MGVMYLNIDKIGLSVSLVAHGHMHDMN